MKQKRIILFLVLVVAVAVIYFILTPQGPKTVPVESQAPQFSVADLTGKIISSSDLKGKVVFVNFWASWCQPCKEEMPSVEKIYRTAGSDPNFVMITILYRDSPENGLGYMKSQGFSFPVYTDPGERPASNFGVTGVPETYVIDKKGALRRRMIGPADWGSPEEISFVTSLLKE